MFHIPAHKSGSAAQFVPSPPAASSRVQPMSQFEKFQGMGFVAVTVIDNSRWDPFYGFRRVVKLIEQPL